MLKKNWLSFILLFALFGSLWGLGSSPAVAQATNLAQGKPATASSAQTANPVVNGNDGNTGTRWCAANGNTGQWWRVDLGASYNLTGSEVMWEFSGRVYKYRVEVSTNDSTWTTIVDKTNNTSTAQTQNDPFTATARYVRITITGLPTSPVTWASFFEFRVFGASGPTATPTRTNTPGGPTSTPTRTPTRTPTSTGPTATPTRTSTPAGGNQNPVLPGYNADPTGIIFGNTFYIYPTTDGIANWGATSFKAWSSPNLVDWTDRGVILDLANVSWCSTHDRAWAPSMIQRGATYYFYFSACGQTGVAASSSPTGPFTDIKGSALASQIDPMVFADTDGSYYLYWGQSTMKWGKLNADMKSFSSTGTISPAGFREGSFVFKRNSTYYFMWSENDTRDENYQVAYGVATSATGAGFVKKGVILSKNTSLGILGTGHHSVIQTSSGQYYIIYHRFGIPGGDGTHREVCIDKLEFNTDGTLKPVTVTLTGIQSPVTP